MRVLVVGGSGFIGTRLVSKLLDAGHKVKIFDKVRSISFPELTILGDVRDKQALSNAVENSDLAYNLAAEHTDNVRPTSLYYQVNVDGMRNLVEACDANGVRVLVFTSTVAVYGLDAGIPDEESPTRPFNDYGMSKLQAEEILREWAKAGDYRHVAIVRPSVVFGEGNRGNVYNLIRQIASGHFLMIGDGSNRKSMGYIENVAAFLTTLVETQETGVEIYNYADKPDLTTHELVSTVRKGLGICGSIRSFPYWMGMAGGAFFDILAAATGRSFPVSRIRIRKFCSETVVASSRMRANGFTPAYSLEEGLTRFLKSEFGD